MKKLTALLTTLALALSLTACGPKAPAASSGSGTPAASSNAPGDSSAQPADDGYTSLDDFILWNEDGTLTTTGRDATGQNAVVSSGKYEASKIGRTIIENGGNAVDAAVAVAFTLGLVEPNATGLGGGGFMTMRSAETGEIKFINFRECAPAAATPDMWQVDAEGKVIGSQNMSGGKAVGVPGTVAGMLYALENYGTMSRDEIVAPIIELAEKGFTVTPTLSADMNNTYDKLMLYSESGKIFLKDVDGILLPYDVGDTFVNKDYAKTLRLIAKDGADVFYKGEIAEAMVKAVQKYGGLLTMEDLANYQVEVMEPVHGTYRGYDIYSSPSPSSGGTIILEILNILENFDVPSMEHDSAEKQHLVGSAFAMAYADRGEYMGDTKYVDVPVNGLANKDYAAKLAAKIDMDTAMTNVLPDDPWMYEHEDTTHFSVADKEGNIVSVTFTVNGYFGAAVAADGYGFILNNEMGDFNVGAGHPNSIAGGKTPLSSMSPTIIMKDGEPFAAIGSPGGTTIIATVAQICSNLIDHGMTMQEAVDAPRISGFRDTTLNYESRFSSETIAEMEAKGWTMNASDEFNRSFGSVNAVRYAEDGTLDGAGDPRRDGKALGF
ncbi:gamma-glutamyltransferase [Lawsonibacter sp. JLR.KK007]|jgi:gamma-glutamyltranspeptidase/glutathione hydrolase|uniref:gamma-glutamyltransferase n=1 Tax=Lawsonibacter sp. JLR.KK007 TaxID=3114293 RepID=UPI002FF26901